MSAPNWFVDGLGWKKATRKAEARCNRYFGRSRGPNLADLSGASSTRIAGSVYEILEVTRDDDTDLGSREAAQAQQAERRRSGDSDPGSDTIVVPAAGA